MYWHEGMGYGGWWGLGMALLWLLLLAALALLVAWVARGAGPGGSATGPTPHVDAHHGSTTARRILDERFARGEVDEDTYRRSRDALRAG